MMSSTPRKQTPRTLTQKAYLEGEAENDKCSIEVFDVVTEIVVHNAKTTTVHVKRFMHLCADRCFNSLWDRYLLADRFYIKKAVQSK